MSKGLYRIETIFFLSNPLSIKSFWANSTFQSLTSLPKLYANRANSFSSFEKFNTVVRTFSGDHCIVNLSLAVTIPTLFIGKISVTLGDFSYDSKSLSSLGIKK